MTSLLLAACLLGQCHAGVGVAAGYGVQVAAPVYQAYAAVNYAAPVVVAQPQVRVVRRQVLVPQAAVAQVNAYSAGVGLAAGYGNVGAVALPAGGVNVNVSAAGAAGARRGLLGRVLGGGGPKVKVKVKR